MMRYLDDVLASIGCALLLIGVWKMFPDYIWFAGGLMCLVLSFIVGLGGARNDHQ